jgi:hypothetical protein
MMMGKSGKWSRCSRSAVAAAFFLWLGIVAALAAGFPIVDFQRYFPQFLAVSEEVQTKEFPQGVQYKFLSIWDEQDQLAYVMVIRRDG